MFEMNKQIEIRKRGRLKIRAIGLGEDDDLMRRDGLLDEERFGGRRGPA